MEQKDERRKSSRRFGDHPDFQEISERVSRMEHQQTEQDKSIERALALAAKALDHNTEHLVSCAKEKGELQTTVKILSKAIEKLESKQWALVVGVASSVLLLLAQIVIEAMKS